jgi:multidrug efflux system membrane fusion protein
MNDRAPTDPEIRISTLPPVQARPSRFRSILGIGLGLVIAATLAWWIHLGQGQRPQTGKGKGGAVPTSVGVAPVQKGDVDIALNALGTVTSLSTVTVKAQVSGQLIRVAFQEGQIVKQGDLLAEIDPRPFEATVAQMQGQLERDQALLAGAKVDLARYQRLAKTNAIPQQQLDTQAALVKQYEGQVAADQGQLNTAKVNLSFTRILSPSDGRAGLRQVDQGNYITANDPNGVVVITQIQPISVIFTVPEDNVPTILKRFHGGTELAVTVFDRSGTNTLGSGVLTTLDNQIDPTTGTVKLRAQFPNTDETLYPNQFVNVRLLVDVIHDAVVMPSSAVQRGAPGTFVYLVNPNNTVSVRQVDLGPVDGERVVVRKGLALDDRVVVDGADKLRDGIRINVRDGGAAKVSSENLKQSE